MRTTDNTNGGEHFRQPELDYADECFATHEISLEASGRDFGIFFCEACELWFQWMPGLGIAEIDQVQY